MKLKYKLLDDEPGVSGSNAPTGEKEGEGANAEDKRIDMNDPTVKKAIEEATKGLTAKRDELLKEVRGFKDKMKLFENIDVEKYQKLIEEDVRRQEEIAAKKGEFEKLREQLVEKTNKQLTEKDKEISKIKQALETHLIDNQLTSELARQKGIPDLLVPIMRPNLKVIQNDTGLYDVVVIDKDGSPRLGPEMDGRPMSIAQLVEEYKNHQTYSRAFETSGNSGAGTGKSSDEGAGNSSNMSRTMTPTLVKQMEDAAKRGDMATFKKLRDAASNRK